MCLFPEDTGRSSPNRSNNYKFEMASSSEQEEPLKPFVYPANALARPYAWAQWICGKVHLSRASRPEPSIHAVLSQIQKRVLAQVMLSQQLSKLAKAKSTKKTGKTRLTIEIHEAAEKILGRKPLTALEAWKELKDCQSSLDLFASTETSEKSNMAGCRYFSALFRHDDAGLRALVEISTEYPTRPPRFCFQNRSGNDSTTKFDQQLKGIEIEVNAYASELVPGGSENWMLMHQLRKVQLCFDQMMKSGADETLSFGRSRRGKDRRQAIAVNVQDGQLTHR